MGKVHRQTKTIRLQNITPPNLGVNTLAGIFLSLYSEGAVHATEFCRTPAAQGMKLRFGDMNRAQPVRIGRQRVLARLKFVHAQDVGQNL